MDSAAFPATLRRRWRTVVGIAAAGVAAGTAYWLSTPPAYEATTQLYVSVPAAGAAEGAGSAGELVQGSEFAQRQIASYAHLAGSPAVLGPVVDELGLGVAPTALADRVRASTPPGTSFVELTVRDTDAARAVGIAQATADQLIAAVADLEDAGTGSPVRVSVAVPPSTGDGPVSPVAWLAVAVGLVSGLVAGVAAAALRDARDGRVRTAADLERLAHVRAAAELVGGRRPLAVRDAPDGARAEAYRRLRTIVAGPHRGPVPTLVVAAVADERRSAPDDAATADAATVAANLALSLAAAGSRTLLVDADLRRPAVAGLFDARPGHGLVDVLRDGVPVADATVAVAPGLEVLAATPGELPAVAGDLVPSEAMRRLLTDRAAGYGAVVVSCAPLPAAWDAAGLAAHAGGVLLVVRSGTSRDAVAGALDALEDAGAGDVTPVVLHADRRATAPGRSVPADRAPVTEGALSPGTAAVAPSGTGAVPTRARTLPA
ncbi:Wzz/FepE/Etk N-terminal domain-containing protein [Puerhibacterium sp. TATVAM-FAB25]|uniref:Wzz/FepE/Etk N-terminal domain-containing protein n=1 Tax=Puerhibacterium sp. TATVAM-FAB25 TaxID=3093699 RepID=UPI00397CB41A